MKKYAFLTVFLTVFLDILGFGIIIPLLPFYASDFGANEFTVGILMASNAVGQFIFNPIWGRLSDKWGRRPIMIITVIGSCIAYLLFGLAQSIALLFISRILAGISGASIGVAQSYISDTTDRENRSKVMGQLGAAFALGFVFGPALSGFLAKFSYSMPGYVAAGLSLINLIMVLLFLPESNSNRETEKNEKKSFNWSEFYLVIKNQEMLILMGIQFFTMFSMSNLFATASLFLKAKFNFDPTQSAYVFTYFGFCSSIVQGLLVGKLVKKFGEKKLLSASLILISLGLGLMPFSLNLLTLIVSITIVFLGNGILNPCITSLISQKANKEQMGVTMGASQSLGSLARIFGPLWGGYIFYVAGYQYPYITGSIITGMTFLFYLKLIFNKKQANEPEGEVVL